MGGLSVPGGVVPPHTQFPTTNHPLAPAQLNPNWAQVGSIQGRGCGCVVMMRWATNFVDLELIGWTKPTGPR